MLSPLVPGERGRDGDHRAHPVPGGGGDEGEPASDVGPEQADALTRVPHHVVGDHEVVELVEVPQGVAVSEPVVAVERFFRGPMEVDAQGGESDTGKTTTEVLVESGHPLQAGEYEHRREAPLLVGPGDVTGGLGGPDRDGPRSVHDRVGAFMGQHCHRGQTSGGDAATIGKEWPAVTVRAGLILVEWGPRLTWPPS